ncbi:MAG TPA: 2TM domain-containing protein [Pricia sp.]|nr:2TM domain-containing protein [Pricia sp.]
METNRTDKRIRAKKKVEELKGFYIHLLIYVLVNLIIIVASVTARLNNGEGFVEALFNFGTFVTAIFWGIGLAFHASKTFGYNPFFGKDWEDRQIKKYMEEDRRDAEKFNKR